MKLKLSAAIFTAFRPLQNFDVSTVSLHHLTLQRIPIAHIFCMNLCFILFLNNNTKGSIKDVLLQSIMSYLSMPEMQKRNWGSPSSFQI